jgi:hypothetical protein
MSQISAFSIRAEGDEFFMTSKPLPIRLPGWVSTMAQANNWVSSLPGLAQISYNDHLISMNIAHGVSDGGQFALIVSQLPHCKSDISHVMPKTAADLFPHDLDKTYPDFSHDAFLIASPPTGDIHEFGLCHATSENVITRRMTERAWAAVLLAGTLHNRCLEPSYGFPHTGILTPYNLRCALPPDRHGEMGYAVANLVPTFGRPIESETVLGDVVSGMRKSFDKLVRDRMYVNRVIGLLNAANTPPPANQNYCVMSNMQRVRLAPPVEDVLFGATSRDCRSNLGHIFLIWTVESRRKKVLTGQFYYKRDGMSGDHAKRFHRWLMLAMEGADLDESFGKNLEKLQRTADIK